MTPLARSLDRYLAAKGSPLAGLGSVFVTAGQHYGVDPKLLVSISGAETSFGTDPNAAPDIAGHNAWGWGPGIKFSSWPDAIDTIARGLHQNYISQGLTTIPQIQSKWAPSHAANDPTGLNSNWTKNVSKFYSELGGRALASAPPATQAAPTVTPPTIGAATPSAAAGPDPLQVALAGIFQSNQQRLGVPALNPLLLLGLGSAAKAAPIIPPPTAPPPVRNLQTANVSLTPLQGKLIGKPFQGTHATGFNNAHGSGNWESENAIDVAAPVGSPIRALSAGVIGPQFGSLGEGGRFAGLRLHLLSPSNEYYYAHLSRFAPGIKPGARVTPGEVIGYSGEANGVPHLHLAFRTGNPLSLYS